MLDWSPATIKGTIGSGGIGILMLSIPSLDAMHIHFWVAFTIALMPALVFVVATPDMLPPRAVRMAQLGAVGWYALSAVLSLGVALVRGFEAFQWFFLAFVLLGAWPCVLAVRAHRQERSAVAQDEARHAARARRRELAARMEREGSIVFRASRRKGLLLLAGSLAAPMQELAEVRV